MTVADLDDLRRHHRQAVERSLRAGYDVVYVYAAHGLTTLQHFLSRRYNDRDRRVRRQPRRTGRGCCARCSRTRARGARAARPSRAGSSSTSCSAREGIERGEVEQLFGLVGELPDVWDVMVGVWDDDSITSRFGHEGWTEEYFRGLKALTSKPVVGVGWFTSPDTMVRLVRDGVLDLIGAARPSIADPFLPRKIEEGRLRGHPRVHRLQRLRHRRLDRDADPVHAEPVDGRGVAPRLASGAFPGRRDPRRRCSSSAPAPRGSRRRWRSASAATT